MYSIKNFTMACLCALDMTPTIPRIFGQGYRKQTKYEPVNLTTLEMCSFDPDAEGATKWVKVTTQKVNKFLKNLSFRAMFSKPMKYNTEISKEYTAKLKKSGHTPLSIKPALVGGEIINIDSYNVLALKDDPNVILKLATDRIPLNEYIPTGLSDPILGSFAHFQKEEALLRFRMVEIMKDKDQKHGFNLRFPKEVAIRIPGTQEYIIASERISVLSAAEMGEAITDAPPPEQKALAHRVADFIEKTGFTDTQFAHLAFEKADEKPLHKRTIVVLNSEAKGCLEAQNSDSPLPASSIEKCAKIGLARHLREACKFTGDTSVYTNEMLNILKKKRMKYEWDKQKLLLSLTIIYPLALLLIATIKYVYIYCLAVRFKFRTIQRQEVLQSDNVSDEAKRLAAKNQSAAAMPYHNAINEIAFIQLNVIRQARAQA